MELNLFFLAPLLQCTSIDCSQELKKKKFILINFSLLFRLKNIFSFFLFHCFSLWLLFFLPFSFSFFFSLPHLLSASLTILGSSSSSNPPSLIFIAFPSSNPLSSIFIALSFIVVPSLGFMIAVWLDFMVAVGSCSWLAVVVDRFVVFLL